MYQIKAYSITFRLTIRSLFGSQCETGNRRHPIPTHTEKGHILVMSE